MYKKIIYRLLAIFLFVFISVTFLIPSDLNAETRKFWVKDGHYEDQNVWVTSGYFKDTQEKRWVDTSHMVESGYWETKKEWVDTSYMVYQGYWKDVSKSFWVDTSYWVSSGYWKDVTEKVWVTSGYTAYRDSKFWVDTSHWEKQAYNVWVSSGYTAYRNAKFWVNTSHWETRSYNVWVSSGYWAGYWVNTSHWETRWYYYYGWRSYRVWVSSGYWGSKWVNTSHWETRSYNVWVSSGYWQTYREAYWVDTSHWETRSYNVWVSSGYWQTYREAYWVDTSHWEDQKVWAPGHYDTRYRYVEDWEDCSLTEYEYVSRHFWHWGKLNPEGEYLYMMKRFYNGKTYKCYVYSLFVPQDSWLLDITIWYHYIKYVYYEVLNWKKEAYSEWVEGYWKREWVDTSHWVSSGYWQSYTYRAWVDTSYLKSEGYWETKVEWVDTSHIVESGYWEDYTKRTWVDTSHFETRDIWVDTSYWIEANLDPEGKVLHTDQWNLNRIKYNLSKTGDPENPRAYNIFFNGEKFVLEAETPGDFQPGSVHVEFLGTGFETYLTNTGDSKWEGYIWDESFIYFHDRDCVFKFTVSYDYNGDQFEIDDEVTVYIVRDYYWELHRLF